MVQEKKDKNKRLYAKVSGRVQGVGFRYSTVIEARKIGVSGYVRNLPDGSVEVIAEGDVDKLEKFLVWLKQGPPASRVTNIDSHYMAYKGYFKSFYVEY